MTKIKLLIVAIFFAITSNAYAKPVLDVIVPSGTKGNAFAESNLISDALKELGYDSEVVVTKNCVNNKAYMAKNTGRPGVFLRDTSRYVKDESRNCKVKVDDKSFLTVFYQRHQTMCVRADQPFTNINDFLKGKSRVTVANTASLFDGVYDELTEETGVKFVRVDINGSKNIIKALIAGDTDLMYSGFTKREINNKQINCFTTSSNTEIAGRTPMNKLFPKWRLNETGTLKYFHAANIDDSNLDTVRKDLKRVIESEKIASYIEKAYMTPGTQIDDQQKAFWSIVDVLTGKN